MSRSVETRLQRLELKRKSSALSMLSDKQLDDRIEVLQQLLGIADLDEWQKGDRADEVH